jgi:ISXO2-like transposase domain
MGRISKKNIINEDMIYSTEDIMSLDINEKYLDSVLSSREQQNMFLARCSIIRNSQRCLSCEANNDANGVASAPILMAYTKKSSLPDGYVWSCKKPCRVSVCLRKDSFFSDTRKDIGLILKILYKYLKGDEFQDIEHELGCHRTTISGYADLAREVICDHIANNSEKLGGFNLDGSRKVVEIDESMFFKRKYNRGRLNNGQWFVGGIERGSKKVFIVPVLNRNAQTMREIINEFVFPGTIIVTDEWLAYGAAIRELNGDYIHKTVNHSQNFVHPSDSDVHTQNIEGIWSKSKMFLRSKSGVSSEQHYEYITQFIWEYKIEKRKRFNTILSLLKINLD